MRRLLFIGFFFGVLFGCSAGFLSAHPFKASITEIRQNPQTGKFEVTLKLFTDDLEECVRESSGKLLYLDTDRELSSADSLLDEYLQSGFRIKVNGKLLDLAYLGREHDPGVTWCYLESESIAAARVVYIVNSIMTEMYSTQSNIVHVKVGQEKKSLLLGRDRLSGELEFGPQSN